MVKARSLRDKLKTLLHENADFEAFELIRRFSGLDRTSVLRGDELSEDEERKILSAAKRRADGEPLQYILGEWDFDGRRILCRPGVLIPREDTLCLVDAAERLIREQYPLKKSIQIIDIGCGSGCIGLSLIKRLHGNYDMHLTALDISPEALALTEENARLWDVDCQVTIQLGDILQSIPDGPFDLVVSNPPYIKKNDLPLLDKTVRQFEPLLALGGGEDGLIFYRRISQTARQLTPSGLVAVEAGYDTATEVQRLFLQSGFSDVTLLSDANGLPRVVTAKIF